MVTLISLIQSTIQKAASAPSAPKAAPAPAPGIAALVREQAAAVAARPVPTPTPIQGLAAAVRSQNILIQTTATAIDKAESTAQTYGQMYTVQTYNADGNVVTKTIALSELQGTKQDFSPNTIDNSLTPAQRAQEAQLLEGLSLPAFSVSKAIQDSLKVDYFMCLKSGESTPLEFNNFQTPASDAVLNYNFYTSDETNIATQEDPANDLFTKNQEVPRYVNITWTPVDTVEESSDFATKTKEEEALVQQYLKAFRGVSSTANTDMANSFVAMSKKVDPVNRSGKQLRLVDTHDLPTAFDSISNAKIFKTSVGTVFNINSVDLNKIDFNDLILDEL